MNKPMQNSASWSETLKIRKTHLDALLKIINEEPGKASRIQTLTLNAIKSEVAHIEILLNQRK